ncbi:MAG: 6-bladed beta-propeller, partial [Bacteroidales bacterium]|nr:6-bladed beta-propeller [Bacteroidales bacterium]
MVQLSEIAESIEYIPLETNRNSMIDKVSWSSLVFENNKYYIRTRFEESIFVFDSVGKFLFKFNRTGRGPEEYEYLAGFTVDPDGNIIIRSV